MKRIKAIAKNKWFISFAVGIISLVLIFGVPVAINELYKLNDGYLTLWGAAEVLEFYAVVLSGLITIGALVVTIHCSKKDTEKQIEFSKSQINVPFFVIEKIAQNSAENENSGEEYVDGIWEREYAITKYGKNEGEIIITLKNIGDGIAIAPTCVVDSGEDTQQAEKFVCKNGTYKVNYDLKQVLKEKFGEQLFPNESTSFEVCILLCYESTLGKRFSQKIVFQHDYNINNNKVKLIVNNISHQNIER